MRGLRRKRPGHGGVRAGPSAGAVLAVVDPSNLSMTACVDIDMTTRERPPTGVVLESAGA